MQWKEWKIFLNLRNSKLYQRKIWTYHQNCKNICCWSTQNALVDVVLCIIKRTCFIFNVYAQHNVMCTLNFNFLIKIIYWWSIYPSLRNVLWIIKYLSIKYLHIHMMKTNYKASKNENAIEWKPMHFFHFHYG